MSTVGRVWPHGMTSSLRQDWATPKTLFEMLDQEFDFQLDACATRETCTVPRWIQERRKCPGPRLVLSVAGNAGLVQPSIRTTRWRLDREAYRESQHGCTVVLLLAARTDTQWFHEYCLKGEIRFLRGRLTFDDKKRGRCPFPSMIVVFRPNPR